MSKDLIRVADRGFISSVKRELASGADVNAKDKYGDTALIVASQKGHAEIVELLLANGAHVNAKDKYGETAIMKASSMNHIKIVTLLLANGAHVSAKDKYGNTALIMARYRGDAKIADLLLENGADVDAQELSHGYTALMKASFWGNSKMVELLLAKKANTQIKDNKGKTALDIAKEEGRSKAMELIENHIMQPIKQSISAMTQKEIASPDNTEMLREKVPVDLIPQVFQDLNLQQQMALYKVFLPEISKDNKLLENIKKIMNETHAKSKSAITTAKTANFFGNFTLSYA